MKYKDKCDSCGKFDYLKGFQNKCLCKNCIPKKELLDKPKITIKQMTIFDILEVI